MPGAASILLPGSIPTLWIQLVLAPQCVVAWPACWACPRVRSGLAHVFMADVVGWQSRTVLRLSGLLILWSRCRSAGAILASVLFVEFLRPVALVLVPQPKLSLSSSLPLSRSCSCGLCLEIYGTTRNAAMACRRGVPSNSAKR